MRIPPQRKGMERPGGEAPDDIEGEGEEMVGIHTPKLISSPEKILKKFYFSEIQLLNLLYIKI